MYKTVWTPFIGEELPLKAEDGNSHDEAEHAVAVIQLSLVQPSLLYRDAPRVSPHPHSTYVSICGSWPRPRHYTTGPGVYSKPGVYYLFLAVHPRRLNEAGVYLMPAFIRGNTVCTCMSLQKSKVFDGLSQPLQTLRMNLWTLVLKGMLHNL